MVNRANVLLPILLSFSGCCLEVHRRPRWRDWRDCRWDHRRTGLPWGWQLAAGVISVLAGIAALVFPPLTLAAILGFISVFALVSGITLLIGALRMGSMERAVAPT